MQIARKGGIEAKGPHLYLVPSQSHGGTYVVDVEAPGWSCTCPDAPRTARCKHNWAVEFTINRTIAPDGTVTETRTVTVKRDWKILNRAYEAEKPNVRKLLSSLCEAIPEAEQATGRPRAAIGAVIAGLFWKVFETTSGRRAMDDIEGLERSGLVDESFDVNTYYKYMVDPSLMPMLESLIQISARPFAQLETDFSIDSTGISTHYWDRWHEEKWGEDGTEQAKEQAKKEEKMERKRRAKGRKHEWVSLHVSCGNLSHVVTAVKVMEGHAADSPRFVRLVDQTAKTFRVEKVCADKAYAAHKNVLAVASVGGVPFIPPKIDSSPRGKALYNRLIAWALSNPEAFDAEYHGRSQVECTFHMIKAKFGSYVRSRDPVAQINEVLLKVLCHNLCRVSEFMEKQLVKPAFWTVDETRAVRPLKLVGDEVARATHPLLGNDNTDGGDKPKR